MLENLKVREWMTTPVITVLPGTPLKVAHEIMKQHGIRRLIVAEQGRMMGIVTLGDLREASPSDATTLSMWELNYLWSQVTVESIMTHSTITVGPDDSIIDAAELMLDHKISGLPVADNKVTVVGVISEADIFRALIKLRVSDKLAS